MKPGFFVSVSIASAAVVAGCGKEARPAPDVLATVGGVPVTAGAFRYHWNEGGDLRPDSPAERRAALDELVARAAFAAKARELGLDDDPEVVAQFENLLVRRMREKQLEPLLAAVEVTDDEVAAYYEHNKDAEFSSPARDRLAVLWFRTRGHDPLVARYGPRMEEARSVVVDNPGRFPPASGFGKFALTCSEHRATRYKGGDLGWIEASGEERNDRFLAAVVRIGRDLKEVGDVSPVVQDGEGLYVVRLMDRREVGVRPLDEVREGIGRKLLSVKRRHAEEAFTDRIMGSADVVVFDENLSSLARLSRETRVNADSGLARELANLPAVGVSPTE